MPAERLDACVPTHIYIMNDILCLINGMSPYLLLGFGLAGLMHAFIPNHYFSDYLSRPNLRSVAYATLFGIPLPLCSCGVIPTAMSLRREGASQGAVTAFLVATPQTGIDSIIATYSLMGWPFALIRPFAAIVTALFAGTLTHLWMETSSSAASTAASSAASPQHPHGQCRSFASKMREAVGYAYVEMMGDIGKWLAIGLVVAALITAFVPAEAFAVFQGNTWASMLLVLCIAVPMYLCATGSIPIAVALMMKGLTPGAALVLLMAGPACNMASLLVVRKVLGGRTLAAYLVSIILGAVGFGALIDHLQFSGKIDFLHGLSQTAACCHDDGAWWMWASTILLLLLLVNALLLPRFGLGWGKAHDHCHCHCQEHEPGNHHHDCCCGHQEHHDGCGCTCGDPECGCCQTDAEAENGGAPAVVHLTVRGMTCSHCAATVEKTLRSLEGVAEVEVHQASGRVIVRGTAEAETLMQAIGSIGFEADLA